jgi:HD-GYP domain-containing protein (c-di-GMP phosphodiesterase class II)
MRFVPTHCIREGMILGDNLYNNLGDLMLSQGAVLTADYVSAIKRLKYNGIYIDDDISKDIDVINVINDRVRADSVKAIRNTFIHGERENNLRKKDMADAKAQINMIVEEIFHKKDLMVNVVDMKVFDDYTYYHSVNVAVLSIILGVALEMSKEDLCNLGFAAILHDIGKVFVDRKILNKASHLTKEEFEEMKSHSMRGCEHIKKGYGVSLEAYMGIMDHHEKYDGGGYPNDIKGKRITFFGRIISVADVYDALTSDRPYRKALLPAEAMEYIMGATKTYFDPEIVEAFVKKIAPYPVGTCVKLSNGFSGIVTENFEGYGMRPKVRIFQEEEKLLDTPYEIMLSDFGHLNLTVIDIL